MGTFLCSRCGETHPGPPLGYDNLAPALWYSLPDAERERRTRLDAEACVIDDQFFFLKGNLYLPVVDGKGFFTHTLWVAVGRQNFARALALWKDPVRTQEPAYPGWLSNQLLGYPATINLKAFLHSRRVGSRFFVELSGSPHPLVQEHLKGVTQGRIQGIAEAAVHPLFHEELG